MVRCLIPCEESTHRVESMVSVFGLLHRDRVTYRLRFLQKPNGACVLCYGQQKTVKGSLMVRGMKRSMTPYAISTDFGFSMRHGSTPSTIQYLILVKQRSILRTMQVSRPTGYQFKNVVNWRGHNGH